MKSLLRQIEDEFEMEVLRELDIPAYSDRSWYDEKEMDLFSKWLIESYKEYRADSDQKD